MTSIFIDEPWLIALQMALALLLDRWLGECRRWHPLVGFGNVTNALEARCNPQAAENKRTTPFIPARVRGALCWLWLVLPVPLIIYLVDINQPWLFILNTLVLYFALGLNSLQQHAEQIYQPLLQGDLATARHFTGYIVSRDTQNLSVDDMSRATVESVLENGHDGVIASLIYFILGGAPLVLLHRLANTLDAMWGYKNKRFNYFGWCAARMDDLLGCLSAYCTALLYALQCKNWHRLRVILVKSWQQSRVYKSHNGGLCMASGASVMGCQLGGTAIYHGQPQQSPALGSGRVVNANDIPQALQLVSHSAWVLVVLVLLCGSVLSWLLRG